MAIVDTQPQRQWARNGVWVSTTHPQFGELKRGRIWQVGTDDQARGLWRVENQDYELVDIVAGDYLAAEGALLAATTWADEPAGPNDFRDLDEDQAAEPEPAAGEYDTVTHCLRCGAALSEFEYAMCDVCWDPHAEGYFAHLPSSHLIWKLAYRWEAGRRRALATMVRCRGGHADCRNLAMPTQDEDEPPTCDGPTLV